MLIHGESRTRLYRIWKRMRQRCSNPKDPAFCNYGGRGISVCEEWNESYHAFRDWALANGYRDDLTIDRKDNNGPYSPENCRWATKVVQANNTRANHLFEVNGEVHTLAEWSKILGIHHTSLLCRLKRGWSIEETFSKPLEIGTDAAHKEKSKPVVCVETGQTFPSASKASMYLGLGRSAVSVCLSGRNATAGGYHWRYANEKDIPCHKKEK